MMPAPPVQGSLSRVPRLGESLGQVKEALGAAPRPWPHPGRPQWMVSKGEPLVEVPEAKPPGGVTGQSPVFSLSRLPYLWIALTPQERGNFQPLIRLSPPPSRTFPGTLPWRFHRLLLHLRLLVIHAPCQAQT